MDFEANAVDLLLFAFACVGLLFMWGAQIPAAGFYLMLLMLSLVFIFIAYLIYKKDDIWFEIPINTSNEKAVFMLFFGIALVIGLKLVTGSVGLSFFSPPLNNFGQIFFAGSSLSYQTLSIVASAIGTIFLVVVVAGIIEEIALGWGFVKLGSVIGWCVRKLLRLDNMSSRSSFWWDFVFAMIFSGICFSGFHIYNGSYLNVDGTFNMGMFVFAFGFRIIVNVMMFLFGNFGLSFGFGSHMANNGLTVASGVWSAALTSFPGGLILVGIFSLFAYFFVISLKKIFGKNGVTSLVAKDFMTVD